MQTPPKLDITVPAVVWKLGRNVIQHGGLGVIRSLGQSGVPVFASVDDCFAPAGWSRYLAGRFLLPRERGEQEILEHLRAISGRIGPGAILICTDDAAAAFTSEHSSLLGEWFRLPPIGSKLLPRRLANKRSLYLLCRKLGVACPATVLPQSISDVDRFVESTTFPVVVKAADPGGLPNGLRSVTIVRTPEELRAICIGGQLGFQDQVLQEYIPRDCAEDWIYHGYTNQGTGCRLGFTGRKLRSYPALAGVTTLGVASRNEELASTSEELLNSLGYSGIVDLDYCFDRRDGKYKLVDFNPRVGANFRLFETIGGVDVVRALHLDLTGRSVPSSRQVESRRFLVEPYDLLAAPSYVHNGELTLRAWWRSFGAFKQLETAWFHGKDWLPLLLMCWRLMTRGMRHGVLSLSSRFTGKRTVTDGKRRTPGTMATHNRTVIHT